MQGEELIKYASDAAARGDDLFTLLTSDTTPIDATSTEADIRRAFRRKALTAHPDKAGDAYDPLLYERLERARDVLLNAEARVAYDNGMRAILQKKATLDAMSAKRRRLVEELHEREEAAKKQKMDEAKGKQAVAAEVEAMARKGRAKLEERRRLMREAEEREQRAAAAAATEKQNQQKKEEDVKMGGTGTDTEQPPAADGVNVSGGGDDYDSKIAELERKLEEKRQRKAEKEKRKADKKAGAGKDGEKDKDNQDKTPFTSSTSNTTQKEEESKADENKAAQPPQPAPVPLSTTATTEGTAAAAAAPGEAPKPAVGGGGFAATMARLKAAQAKRDEERRKREESEAAAAQAAQAQSS